MPCAFFYVSVPALRYLCRAILKLTTKDKKKKKNQTIFGKNKYAYLLIISLVIKKSSFDSNDSKSLFQQIERMSLEEGFQNRVTLRPCKLSAALFSRMYSHMLSQIRFAATLMIAKLAMMTFLLNMR